MLAGLWRAAVENQVGQEDAQPRRLTALGAIIAHRSPGNWMYGPALTWPSHRRAVLRQPLNAIIARRIRLRFMSHA